MKKSALVWIGLGVSFAAAIGGCSATAGPSIFDNEPDEEGSGSDNNGSGGAGGSSTGEGGFNPTTTGSGGNTINCDNPPDADGDGDGFTQNEGDCNNCDPNANPGAVEVIVTEPDMDGNLPEPADEDCDGDKDEVEICDMGLALDDQDPMNGARAIDICQQALAGDKKWGVLESAYVRANGAATVASLQVGILKNFGPNVNVQKGERLLALSSGYGRLPGDPNECASSSCSTSFGNPPPPGFPQDVPGCAGLSNINDDIALQLKLRAPKNATGYKYLFKFYSFEFPEYVCTSYNDQYIALVTPPPMGSINGNISFDSAANPVSVNVAFFDVCDPNGKFNYASVCGGCKPAPNPYCPSGTNELMGNGFGGEWFGDAGGTSWLQTLAPIGPGEEFTIRFAIWDTGDSSLDSTVVLDGFEWIATGGEVTIGTGTVPDPK
jgi:hypothetical protein